MAPIVASTGRISQYGTDAPSTRRSVRGRRRRGHGLVVSAAIAPSCVKSYELLRTEAMLSLADDAACLIVCLPVRICASMLRRILPFSTSTQCFAVGTNQLRTAARSLTLWPSRLVALGMLPFAWSDFSALVLVKSLIQSAAADLSPLVIGTARSEPPRKPGIGWPFVWLGITNCPVAVLNLPTQQLNQLGPIIEPALPCAYTSYGFGWASSLVL